MKIKFRLVFLLILSFSFSSFAQSHAFSIIVNSKVNIDSISMNVLKEIYTGNRSFWNENLRIRPIRTSDSNLITEQFVNTVMSQSLSQYLQDWRLKLFSGKALPPKKAESSQEIISFVEQNEGGIGFVPANQTITSSQIKIISLQ